MELAIGVHDAETARRTDMARLVSAVCRSRDVSLPCRIVSLGPHEIRSPDPRRRSHNTNRYHGQSASVFLMRGWTPEQGHCCNSNASFWLLSFHYLSPNPSLLLHFFPIGTIGFGTRTTDSGVILHLEGATCVSDGAPFDIRAQARVAGRMEITRKCIVASYDLLVYRPVFCFSYSSAFIH